MKTHVMPALCFCAGFLLLPSAPASAQNGPKWEIEVHGGGLASNNPTDGTASMPPAGAAFTTAALRTSRRVSSWYFGDGAALFNEVAAAFPTGTIVRITPLNAVLGSPLAARQNGFDVGGRLSRMLGSRFTVELTLDYSPAKLEMTRAAELGIEVARGSFESSLNSLLASAPVTGRNVTSRSTVTLGNGGQLFTTGTVNVALKTSGHVIPYVTGGAGVLSRLGDKPSATLEGNYQFQYLGVYPMSESDVVSLRASVPDNDVVGVVGGGAKYFASSRWGMRVDGRVYLSSSKLDTVIDATPSVARSAPTAPFPLSAATTPGIQFSNNPPGVSHQSNLTGQAVADFRAFEGGGRQSQFIIAAGLFWRF